MQAGLSALKTPLGLQDNCNVEDPLHLESFRSLAAPLPFSKHLQSKLVCHLTRELMNEHNPPMVLPNGYVYSLKVSSPFPPKSHPNEWPRGRGANHRDSARAAMVGAGRLWRCRRWRRCLTTTMAR